MKHVTGVLLLVFVLLISQVQLYPHENKEEIEGKKYPLNLSLWYPVSINKTKNDEVNLNLALLYSRVGYVYGLDLSLLGSAISHDLEGVQICGLASIVGERGQGAQVSLLSNIVGESFTGFQATGLANIIGESFSGIQCAALLNIAGKNGSIVQAAGLFNIVGENFSGIQASAGFNITGKSYTGLQTVGLFNIAGEKMEGVQAAGLFNIAGESLNGIQLAAFNIAGNSSGVQVGIANVAGNSGGFQLGLVNYTKEINSGLPIGPVNIAQNGRIRGIVWIGSHVAVTGGAKFQINNFFSLLTLGVGNLNDNIGGSATYGFHYGMSFPTGHLTLNPDIGYRYRDNKPLFKKSEHESDQHMLEARIMLGIPLSKKASLIIGAGLTRIFDSGKHIDSGDTSPLIIAGIEFF